MPGAKLDRGPAPGLNEDFPLPGGHDADKPRVPEATLAERFERRHSDNLGPRRQGNSLRGRDRNSNAGEAPRTHANGPTVDPARRPTVPREEAFDHGKKRFPVGIGNPMLRFRYQDTVFEERDRSEGRRRFDGCEAHYRSETDAVECSDRSESDRASSASRARRGIETSAGGPDIPNHPQGP